MIRSIEQLLGQFGNNSLIVKDYVKSRKHEWYDACFIRDASDTFSAMRVIHNFIERQGESLYGGIVLRRYEKLVSFGYHPESGMPLSEEYMAFFLARQLVCISAYCCEAGQKDVTLNKEETAWIESLPKQVHSLFFTADIARSADSALCIMEIGDGQVFGLQGLNENFFYKRINAVYNSVTDICEFRELNNAIVAKKTTGFTLPNGSITVTDCDGTRIPFSVERHYNALV